MDSNVMKKNCKDSCLHFISTSAKFHLVGNLRQFCFERLRCFLTILPLTINVDVTRGSSQCGSMVRLTQLLTNLFTDRLHSCRYSFNSSHSIDVRSVSPVFTSVTGFSTSTIRSNGRSHVLSCPPVFPGRVSPRILLGPQSTIIPARTDF